MELEFGNRSRAVALKFVRLHQQEAVDRLLLVGVQALVFAVQKHVNPQVDHTLHALNLFVQLQIAIQIQICSAVVEIQLLLLII